MSTSFKQALRDAASGVPQQAERALENVLEEFVAWLNEDYGDRGRFSIAGGSHPRLRRLLVSPRGRRNETSTLFVFYLDTGTARALGAESFVIGDDEGLRAYLESYAASPNFESLIAVLGARASDPIEAILRAPGGASDPASDVLILLAPAEFFPLADADDSGTEFEALITADATESSGIAMGKPKLGVVELLAGGHVFNAEVRAVALPQVTIAASTKASQSG